MRRAKRGPTVRAEWMGWVAEDAKRSTSPLGAAATPLTNAQWYRVGQVVRERRVRHRDRDRVMTIIQEVRMSSELLRLSQESLERVRQGVADVTDADLLEQVVELAKRAGSEEVRREDRE